MRKNFGFNMPEVMIATVILTVGLLGFANLQQQSMRSIQNSDNTNAAATLAAEMAMRLTTNAADAGKGKDSTYIKSFSSINPSMDGFATNEGEKSEDTAFLNGLLPSTNKCYSIVGCTSREQAVADLFAWKSQLKQMLPNVQARICFDSNLDNTASLGCDGVMKVENSSIAYTIKIAWDNTKGGRDSYVTQVFAQLNAQQANTNNLVPIGTIVDTTGTVTASNDEQEEPRALSKDSPIYATDLLTTPDNAAVQFKLNDGSIVALQANTKFKIDKFKFNLSEPENNINIMTLIIGGFKTLTGFIADQTPDNYQVKTELATLGVRGTYWGAVFLGATADSPLNVSVWDDPRVGAKKSVVTIKKMEDASTFEIGPGKTFKNAIIPADEKPVEGSQYQSTEFEEVNWINPEAHSIIEVDSMGTKTLDDQEYLKSIGADTSTTGNTGATNTTNTSSDTATGTTTTTPPNTTTNVTAETQALNIKNARKAFLYKKYMEYYKQMIKDKRTKDANRYLKHFDKYKKSYNEELNK